MITVDHDIVACFSSSIDANGNFNEYHVAVGSHFADEYNETLDSGTVILTHIPKELRLFQNNKMLPYEFVRVYDKLHPTVFERFYIVDTFQEKEINIYEHIYEYTINLMSETKILEKIQCPNLSITHKINPDGTTTKLPIWQYIQRYMELFVPPIKYTSDNISWSYQPLIQMPTGSALNTFKNRFSQTSADLSLTANTLRGILTTLMIQVGCIPVVKNRTLWFLDFQAPQETQFGHSNGQAYGYDVNHTVNFINRSWSSDSKATSLVRMDSNVLETDNTVISETLGFRDSSNAFLKQTENLKLETSFPIYKVEEMIMKALVQSDIKFDSPNSDGVDGRVYLKTPLSDTEGIDLRININPLPRIVTVGGNKVIQFSLHHDDSFNPGARFCFTLSLIGKCYLFNGADSSYNDILSEIDIDFNFSAASVPDDDPYDMHYLDLDAEVDPYQTIDANIQFDGAVFVGRIAAVGTVVYNNQLYDLNTAWGFCAATPYKKNDVLYLANADITPLIMEQSVRNMLDHNFVDMGLVTTIKGYTKNGVYHKGLADYVYGTFQYSIGSKEITGFSSVYTEGSRTVFGWLQQNYTYIENIWTFLITYRAEDFASDVYEKYFSNIYRRATIYLDELAESSASFTYHFTVDDVPDILFGSLTISNIRNFNNFHANYSILSDLYDDLIRINELADNEVNPVDNQGHSESGILPTNDLISSLVNSIFSSNLNFGYIFFDIKYQPINSFNISFVKNEDTPFRLEQLDGSADAMSDFDRLSIAEQEKVERIGNETLVINQRTRFSADIQDLDTVYKDDFDKDGVVEQVKYIVFKREFTIENFCFNVNYVASKDAILKDYFTSIRTKYRAYQYIDYNASILRKEKDIVYVLLSENQYLDGDDKIYMGNFTLGFTTADPGVYSAVGAANDLSKLVMFVSGCTDDSYNYVRSVGEYGIAQINANRQYPNDMVKNEVSGVANQNTMAFTYECLDNVGAGPYVSVGQMARGGWYGGILQAYQIWDEETYNDYHAVFYINNFKYQEIYNGILTTQDFGTFISTLDKILYSPKIDLTICDPSQGDASFAVVDSNRGTDVPIKRTFHKDYAERINHTVQFIYYTDSENILWGEEFIRRNGFMYNKNQDNSILYIGKTDKLAIDNQPLSVDDRVLFTSSMASLSTTEWPHLVLNVPSALIDDDKPYIKIYAFNPTDLTYKDILCFKNTVTNIYVSLNDTRSKYVLAEQDGLLYKKDEVMMNTTERRIKSDRRLKLSYSIPSQYIDDADVKVYKQVPGGSDVEIDNAELTSASGYRVNVGETYRFTCDDFYCFDIKGEERYTGATYTVAEDDQDIEVNVRYA